MQTVDFQFLASLDDVVRRQHGRVGGRFFSVGFHFHPSGDSAQSFPAREVGYVQEGVVESGQDVSYSENLLVGLEKGVEKGIEEEKKLQ